MTSSKQLASLPSGIKTVCVIDGYLVLIGMSFAMMGLAELGNRGYLEFGGTETLAFFGMATIGVVGLQLWVLQGVWNVESWAWPASLAMFGLQALSMTVLLLYVATNDVAVGFVDGVLRWFVPLVAVIACAVYIYDQREWFVG